ncbi:MAG: DUF1775 domain-containing protein [Alphaproteobacteria bacterium]|nr:DUF1775 domain-containing protein [Alphaproteobacteria bacterium]
MKYHRVFLAALLAALVPLKASAHVVFADAMADPGVYYAGFLRVGHGCDGSPTLTLTVTIPDGVDMAHPQPKPGWTLETAKDKNGRVTSITWRGRLEADQFDQFGVLVKLPKVEGPLYFPTKQVCEKGEQNWSDIPKPEQDWHDVPHPAPVVNIMEGMSSMMMHH